MKNAKEKTPQPPELQMQNTWKKRKQISGVFPKIHETSQQKKTDKFSFKIIRNSDFDAHVSKPRFTSPPLCYCAGSTALNRLHPWWRICWYFSCFKVFTMILWHFWCDDNVNISKLEFHHCHHVLVGFYLEYYLRSLFPTKMDIGCGWVQHVSQQF